MVPTCIIYFIATNYILVFAAELKVEVHNLMEADVAETVKRDELKVDRAVFLCVRRKSKLYETALRGL